MTDETYPRSEAGGFLIERSLWGRFRLSLLVWLQTVLIEAAKLAPRWNPQLATLHARELELGHPNRATLQVARKLVAYLLAVDKSG